MKYLKLFESSEIDIQLIKDIIIEIRDEYQSITGMIHTHEDFIEIRLNIDKLSFKGKPHTLDNIDDINKFISLIVNVSRRLEDALDRDIRILDLYDFNGSIKILIPNELRK